MRSDTSDAKNTRYALVWFIWTGAISLIISFGSAYQGTKHGWPFDVMGTMGWFFGGWFFFCLVGEVVYYSMRVPGIFALARRATRYLRIWWELRRS